MEKVIDVDIMDLDDFFSKYNKELVSFDLIKFILDNCKEVDGDITIVLNKKIDKPLEDILINSLKTEYNLMLKEHFNNNKMQVIYFLVGIIMLVISRILNDRVLLEELFLIGGWVLIWQTVEIEFFRDIDNKRKRKLLKKLINSKIIEKKIK